jgi:hypothetical protein
VNDGHVEQSLRVSLRETRLIVERLVMLLGVPKGSWAAVREVIVGGEALGLGALAFLDEQVPGAPARMEITQDAGRTLVVTAAGVPAPFAAPALLDLAVATMCEHGAAEVLVVGSTHNALLEALEPAGHLIGADVRVRPVDVHTVALECVPAGAAVPPGSLAALAGGEHLVDAALHGIAVPAPLWWRLYHRSNDALTVDTPISRGHAGAAPAFVEGEAGDRRPEDADPDYVIGAAS